MYKLFAVWTHPDDVEEFEKYYAETHAPLAAAIPGLQRLVLTRTSDFLGDGPAPFHRIAELWFEDADALEIAKESPELEAAPTTSPRWKSGSTSSCTVRPASQSTPSSVRTRPPEKSHSECRAQARLS